MQHTWRDPTDSLAAEAASEVSVGGEIGRRIDATIAGNFLKIDFEEDFLSPFRLRNAKVSSYVGLGKLLDAAAGFAAYRPEVDQQRRSLITEILSTQNQDGYIGAHPESTRMWSLWDVHEMSYLVIGLVRNHRLFQETECLDAAVRLAGFMLEKFEAEPGRVIEGEDIWFWLSTTGFDQALTDLLAVTGDERYRRFALAQRRLANWDDPIVFGRGPKVDGHAYPYLSRCLAQHDLYRASASDGLMLMTGKILDLIVNGDGMVISGACGINECWTKDQNVGKGLGETCTTAHLIWFFDSLLRLSGDARFGDFMERLIYNALFAAQSPEGRKIRYYTPLEGPRSYFDRDTYCCPNNFRRVVSQLPRMIFYRSSDTVWVNLFTESNFRTEMGGIPVIISQHTEYPSSGGVHISVESKQPVRFKLAIRIPHWASGVCEVNGEGQSAVQAGQFLMIERQWKRNDHVTISMQMSFRWVAGRRLQHGKAALMRGPLLFCIAPQPGVALDELSGSAWHAETASTDGPQNDDSIRPGGIRYKATITEEKSGARRLVEFKELPDPSGELTYLPVAASSDVVEDTLFGSR